MAYKPVEWEKDIYKKRFVRTLREKGKTIKEIAEECGVDERGLRRSLNETKRMKKWLVGDIAKRLDVSPRFLVGKYDVLAKREGIGEEEEERWLSMLSSEKFPYVGEEVRDTTAKEYLSKLLGFHGISKEQFRALPFETQLDFLEKIEESLASILPEYFPKSAAGDDTYMECCRIIASLEGRREDFIAEGVRGDDFV